MPKVVPAGRSAKRLSGSSSSASASVGRMGPAANSSNASACSCSSSAPRSAIDASWGSRRPSEARSTMAENDHRCPHRGGRRSSVATQRSDRAGSPVGACQRSDPGSRFVDHRHGHGAVGRRHQRSEVGHHLTVGRDRDGRGGERLRIDGRPLTGEQDMGERRLAAALGAGPPHHGLVLGPGQRHVQQAEALAGRLVGGPPATGQGLLLVRPVGSSGQVEGPPPGVRVHIDHRLLLAGRAPQGGQAHHRELETLGRPHRHDLHRRRLGRDPASRYVAVDLGVVLVGKLGVQYREEPGHSTASAG